MENKYKTILIGFACLSILVYQTWSTSWLLQVTTSVLNQGVIAVTQSFQDEVQKSTPSCAKCLIQNKGLQCLPGCVQDAMQESLLPQGFVCR